MVGFDAYFFWVCSFPFDYVFEGHYFFTRLGFSSRLSFVFGSSVFSVFLSSSLSSFTGIFSAFSVSVPSNSGRDHLPMSSSILAAGFSSPVSSALKVAFSWRFVWNVLAWISTVVDIFLPAFARRIRFLNCVATSVEPDIFIFASVTVSIPSRRLHFSRSSIWIFGGCGSKVSHSFVIVSVVHGARVGSSVFFPHWHGHVRHFGHRCPLGSVSSRFPASPGSRSCESELIVTRVGVFSGAYTWSCWMSTHVPLFIPSSIVCSNRDWFSGRTIPAFLCMFSYRALVVVSAAWAGHASAFA